MRKPPRYSHPSSLPVDLARYEGTMTTLGLACHAKSKSPLKLLPPDVMEQVLQWAGCEKPTTAVVTAAAKARNEGSLAIVPFAGWCNKKNAPDVEVQDMADLDFFLPGTKLVFPLTLPNHHLTSPCYRDLRKHVKAFPNWDVKRTAATAAEKKKYKETRKGQVYFVNVVYAVPGKASRKRKAKPAASSSTAASAAEGYGKKPAAEPAKKKAKKASGGTAKAPSPQPLSPGTQTKATSALAAVCASAAGNAEGSVDPEVMQRALAAGYSSHFILGRVQTHLESLKGREEE